MASIWEFFRPLHSERFACCALTIQYIICSTVGRPIASISYFGEHIYLGASRSMAPWSYTSAMYLPTVLYNFYITYRINVFSGQILQNVSHALVWHATYPLLPACCDNCTGTRK